MKKTVNKVLDLGLPYVLSVLVVSGLSEELRAMDVGTQVHRTLNESVSDKKRVSENAAFSPEAKLVLKKINSLDVHSFLPTDSQSFEPVLHSDLLHFVSTYDVDSACFDMRVLSFYDKYPAFKNMAISAQTNSLIESIKALSTEEQTLIIKYLQETIIENINDFENNESEMYIQLLIFLLLSFGVWSQLKEFSPSDYFSAVEESHF